MAALDGSHHRMTVFDNRQVPGDTADFPAVCLFLLLSMCTLGNKMYIA